MQRIISGERVKQSGKDKRFMDIEHPSGGFSPGNESLDHFLIGGNGAGCLGFQRVFSILNTGN